MRFSTSGGRGIVLGASELARACGYASQTKAWERDTDCETDSLKNKEEAEPVVQDCEV